MRNARPSRAGFPYPSLQVGLQTLAAIYRSGQCGEVVHPGQVRACDRIPGEQVWAVNARNWHCSRRGGLDPGQPRLKLRPTVLLPPRQGNTMNPPGLTKLAPKTLSGPQPNTQGGGETAGKTRMSDRLTSIPRNQSAFASGRLDCY